ncbi:hypothetical protein KJJ90_04895 [Proteus mirabilis]|uniref:hypothetical protein n=1 Tax=Proteus mirabilis TaxID=584 RepID=UPI003315C913
MLLAIAQETSRKFQFKEGISKRKAFIENILLKIGKISRIVGGIAKRKGNIGPFFIDRIDRVNK